MMIIKNLQINAREGVEKREPSYVLSKILICADTIEKLEGFSWWSSSKESAFQCRGLGSIPSGGTKVPHATGD